MTITKDRLRIIIACDACGQLREDQEGQHAKFRKNAAVWKQAQGEGWTSKQKADGRDWDHFCPGCQ